MTLTFTAEQEAVLEGQRKVYADAGQDFADTTAMIQYVMDGAIESWKPMVQDVETAAIREKLRTATREQKNAVEAALGIVKGEEDIRP